MMIFSFEVLFLKIGDFIINEDIFQDQLLESISHGAH